MAAIPIIPTAAGVLVLAILVYNLIIYPAFLSPLAKIPAAHWSARISPAWIWYHRLLQEEVFRVHEAHARLGPLVRLAVNELSVNAVDGGIRTIYTGGFEKSDWYHDGFANYDTRALFTIRGKGPHARRRRMLANVYAKSTLHASPALASANRHIVHERLVPRLDADVATGQPIEFYHLFTAVFMDLTAAYLFGLASGTDYLRHRDQAVQLLVDFKLGQRYVFWAQEAPAITRVLQRCGLAWLVLPTNLKAPGKKLEAWLLECCASAEDTLRRSEDPVAPVMPAPEDYPTVYAQLRNAMLADAAPPGAKPPLPPAPSDVAPIRLDLAAELCDNILAGFDTSGITLTWLAWQLSRPHNASWQAQLHAEAQTIDPARLDPRAIDALPVLHAILMETLRLHAAIPGHQPRITTAPATTLGDASTGVLYPGIPPNVRVQAQAYSLHRDPTVFPAPDTWNPGRWLAASPAAQREMARWFWAFGSGGRMCVGSHLAMHNMKLAMVAVWRRYRTAVVDDAGMRPNGGYMGDPLGVGKGGPKGLDAGRKFLLLDVQVVV